MNLPCENCLCIPVCRHKSYHGLIEGCELAYKYLRLTEDEIVNHPTTDSQTERILRVEKMLNPTRWQLNERIKKE